MRVLEIVSTMGPGRRAAVKVVEMVLLAEADEADRFEWIAGELQQGLPVSLDAFGLSRDTIDWSTINLRPNPVARIAGYVCQIALGLQNAAGHALSFNSFLQDYAPDGGTWRYRFIFQHDDIPGGEQAGDLAMRIVSETCPQLRWKPLLHEASLALPAAIAEFVAGSKPFATPPETLALIAAAQARRIPVLRLEREPYGRLPASFRVAPNGMIMLGHSRYRVILDGLFCIARPGPGFSLMNDRLALWSLLLKLGAKAPVDDLSLMMAGSRMQARRAVRQLGYPLRFHALQRNPAAPEGWLLENDGQLDALLSRPGVASGNYLLEPVLPGPGLQLLFVGGKLFAALQDGEAVTVDAATAALAGHIDQALNCAFLMISFGRSDPGAGWQVTDVNPSPPLTALLQHHPELAEAAYDAFLDWLYPPGKPCRIPIIAITGTNGKTTTSSMISRIAQAESKFVGMARTTGVYFDRELKEFGDSSGFLGHCLVFEHPQVDLAVLETARGDVLRSGFAYDSSDVAICTNVTADHLGEHGVETVADMAVVKMSVLERSVGAVVLNGDDPLCLEMLPHLAGRKLFVSSFLADPDELRRKVAAVVAGPINIIHVVQREGAEWIVLQDGGNQIPIMTVNAIPATFNGAARHNISNAMHAIAGAYALGLKPASIRQALGEFEMGYDSLPGRLNLHDNGRFRIIMDYAHNADGLKQLVRFTDQYPCEGRRILRFGVSPKASRAACRDAAATVAGHFDHYICSAKPGYDPGDGIDTANELRLGLLEHGIREDQMEIFIDISRSVEYPASLCRPGDLLILVTSNAGLAPTWEKILKT